MRFALAALAITTMLFVPPAQAQSPSVGHATRVFQDNVLGTIITETERQIIDRYFGTRRQDDGNHDGIYDGKGKKKAKKNKGKGAKQMPPGLAKRDSLPPGLAKQLRRNGRLPPGLAKRELPNDLRHLLPARGRDHELAIVDDDVILLERTTGVILDILENVLGGGNG